MCDKEQRKCAKCNITATDDPNISFHRFPMPRKHGCLRARVWAEYCYPGEDWTSSKSLEALHTGHKMLCSNHFDESAYTNSPRKRLNIFSIPTEAQNILLKLSESETQKTRSSIESREKPKIKNVSAATPGPSRITPIQACSIIEHNVKESVKLKDVSEAGPSKISPAQTCSTVQPKVKETAKISNVSAEKPGPSKTTPIRACSIIEHNVKETAELQDVIEAGPSKITPAQTGSTVQPQLKLQTKNTRGILRQLDMYKTAELTPKKQKLYRRCRQNLSEILRLRKKLKENKSHPVLPTLLNNEIVLDNKLSRAFATMLQSQIINTPRKLTGRRWSIDDKVMALSIYKRSPACYRLLKKLFCLPSEGTLKSLLNKIPMTSGINQQIFSTIEEIAEKRNHGENLCILAFDEMSIRKNLTYNARYDLIDGYQDHGKQGRSMEPATHVLLFMAIGLRKSWKQPLAFYFSGDSVTADRLSVLIKEVLEASFKAGLIITATVCDNFGVNIKALNSQGSTVACPYFDFKGHEIVTILDPPHLLKCFRNNFMKYDIECTQETKINDKPIKGAAKWSHIKEFYEKDNANPNFVFAPALTKQHLEPNFKQKMKVSLACQVLSHSVAAGMLAKIANNELPQEATATAMVIEKLDKLFDSLNGDTPDLKRGKRFLTNLTQKSPHLPFFKEMKSFFQNIKFIGARTKPPSQDGFIRTLNAVERLFNNLNNYFRINGLSTRRLNQDPLENCFGVVRSNCGSNPNPNTVQFVAALKTSIISNLLHTSKTKNCQDDDNFILHDLKTFLSVDEKVEHLSNIPDLQFDMTINVQSQDTVTPECSGEIQACAYVCGFIIKKLGTNCNNCKTAMLADQNTELSHLFLSFKEYSSIRSSLNYVNKKFTETVELAATKVNRFLYEKGCKKNLKKCLVETLKVELNFNWLNVCSEHFDLNQMHIVVSTICICIKRYCTIKNREFIEEASRKATKRKINILKNI